MEKLTKREKVMLGVSIGVSATAIGVAGYFGFKYYKSNENAKLLEQGMHYLSGVNSDLHHKIETLMEAASEGVFEEAIGTVNNKINHRTDRKKYLLERLAQFPDDIQTKKALEKVETELANLCKRKDKFTEAQAFYAIADVIEEEL